MNLVILAALVAACGAAKLDRTYLPPASSKTAGGSSDTLQTPFSRSSANQGADGLPSGGYTNDFEGVVVDAANPATRVSSGSEPTGLGGPRVSYGSTASKVGDAAFRGSVAGFRQTPTETGLASASGQTSGFQVAPEFNQGSFVARPERPQAASDRNANIIKQESDVGAEAYSYGYETDNGISAGENGVAINGVQAQGGFSYKGDDGQIYSITYTADEGGYRPMGSHLPTPPPIPEEILKSLEQNAKEEAAGIVDDGTYDAQKYNEGGDYPESHNDRQSSQFGNRPESATGSTFINQNQAFGKPTFNTGFSVLGSNLNIPSTDGNTFGQTVSSSQSESGLGFNQNQHSANAFNQDILISSQGQESSDVASSGQLGQIAQASSQSRPFGQAEATVQSSSGTQLGQSPGFGNQGSTSSQFSFQQSSQSSQPQFGVHSSRPQFEFNQIPITQTSNSISSSPVSIFGSQQATHQASGLQFSAQPSRPQLVQNQIPAVEGALTLGSSAQDSRPQFGSQGQLFKPNEIVGYPQGIVSPTNFNRPSFGTSGQGAFNAASNSFGSLPNSASGFNGQPIQVTDLENINEYLPPSNSGSKKPTQGSQPQKPETAPIPSFNQFTTNTQADDNLQTLGGQDRPQGIQPSILSSASVASQPNFDTQSAQLNGFQQTQSTNNVRPGQFTNNVPSTQSQNQYSSNSNTPQYNGNAQQIQSMSSFTTSSQLATSQPQIELTTPLKPNESLPDNLDGSQLSGSSASSFTSFGTEPRPGQPQIGASFLNAQNSSPFATQATATAFSSSSPTSQPQGQKPFGAFNVHSQSAFPTQASFNPIIKFGDRIPQKTFSQNIGDAQYASSTQKPTFSQTSLPQGNDNSYYYNQPSKPFGTPTKRPFGSKLPSAAQNQFNNANTQSSGQNSFFNNRQPNFPASSLPSRNEQFQGQSGKPSAPTLAPITPTSLTQKETKPQSYYNGVTQASISSFAGAPTPSTQFGSQQSSQFGSRPQLPSTQFNRPQTQPQFVINQPTATQQTFPQRPSTQFGQKPSSFQSQSQSQFGQATVSQSQPDSSEDSSSQSIPSQQYNGEVYEYNKPAEVLPATEQTDSTSSQKVQSNIQTDSSDSQSQQPEGSQPALGARPQIDQNPQPNQGSKTAQEPQGTSPQFGAQLFKPTQDSVQDRKPQFKSPFGRPCCQGNKFGQKIQPTQATNQFERPMQGAQTPAQFNTQNTGFQGAETFKPDQMSQGFERGEIFGGPRDPPRFDDKTGYHY